MPRARLLAAAAATLLSTVALASDATPAPSADDALHVRASWLGPDFPLDAAVGFHPAYLHWLDSIAGLTGEGLTAGRTAELHRARLRAAFGPLDAADRQALDAYRELRRAFVRRHRDALPGRLTTVFLEGDGYGDARRRAAPLLPWDDRKRFQGVLDRFAPRFRALWDDGARERAFLDDAPAERRARVGAFLARVADWLAIDPLQGPRARLFPLAVPAGRGTHAQTLHQHLLVEIRPDDALDDQLGTIVHEATHYLLQRLERDRLDAVQERVDAMGPRGARAWESLLEALPTAVGEGVAAAQLVGDGWSAEARWFPRDAVDLHAKLIFPTVRRALDDPEAVCDADVLIELLEAYPGR